MSSAPPVPFGPVPSARQLRWHALEYYGFIHFTVNTFTGKEWGYGDEAPALFNPAAFDAEQIAGAAAAGGMAGLILTCKHHDGFCLWPSRHTAHSVRHAPWRGGRGDLVREVADACRRRGLRFGVYLSPWDRHHADYGRPAYVAFYRDQLRELLTEYGPLFEVWFDGANGGDGYYGGARETRRIDRRAYYDWPGTWEQVRALQPDAAIFSDGGWDVRWVGNERGVAGDPCWHRLDRDRFFPGEADEAQLNSGHRFGSHWVPAECDVSIRKGWFHHPATDETVRSPDNLMDLYYQSVGRGASLLLNLAPDRRGLLVDREVAALREFKGRRDAAFGRNLAETARIAASNVRGGAAAYAASRMLDGDAATYWTCDDGVLEAEIELRLERPIRFNVAGLREFLPLGQRVDAFQVWIEQEGRWAPFARGEAIGHRRLSRGTRCETNRVRITVRGSAPPALSEVALYDDPNLP